MTLEERIKRFEDLAGITRGLEVGRCKHEWEGLTCDGDGYCVKCNVSRERYDLREISRMIELNDKEM